MKKKIIIAVLILVGFITGVVLTASVIMSNAKITGETGKYEVEIFEQVFIYE